MKRQCVWRYNCIDISLYIDIVINAVLQLSSCLPCVSRLHYSASSNDVHSFSLYALSCLLSLSFPGSFPFTALLIPSLSASYIYQPRTRIRENPIIPAARRRDGERRDKREKREGSNGRKGETEQNRAAKARSFPQRGWCFCSRFYAYKPTYRPIVTRLLAVTSRITYILLGNEQFCQCELIEYIESMR